MTPQYKNKHQLQLRKAEQQMGFSMGKSLVSHTAQLTRREAPSQCVDLAEVQSTKAIMINFMHIHLYNRLGLYAQLILSSVFVQREQKAQQHVVNESSLHVKDFSGLKR